MSEEPVVEDMATTEDVPVDMMEVDAGQRQEAEAAPQAEQSQQPAAQQEWANEPDDQWIEEVFFGDAGRDDRPPPPAYGREPAPEYRPPPVHHQGTSATGGDEPDPVDRYVDAKLRQALGPLAYEQHLLKQWIARNHQERVENALLRTAQAVQQHMAEARQDPALANPRVKQIFENELKALATMARQRAERGDFSLLDEMRTPLFRKLLLYGAKEAAGYQQDGAQPVIPRGAMTPKVRQQTEETVDYEGKLGAEFVEALRQAYGSGWTAKAKKYLEQRSKYWGG